jgi:hypothetical protein
LAIGVKCGSKLHFTALEALEPDSCSVSSNRRFRHREPPLAIVSGGRFASCACPQANTVTGDGPQSQKAHSPVNLLAYIALRLRIISDDPVLRPRSKAYPYSRQHRAHSSLSAHYGFEHESIETRMSAPGHPSHHSKRNAVARRRTGRENVKPSTLLVCHRCSSSAFAVAALCARPIRGPHRDKRRPILRPQMPRPARRERLSPNARRASRGVNQLDLRKRSQASVHVDE